MKIVTRVASYLDTSFLLKLYRNEVESDEATLLISTRSILLISPFVEVEIACVLHRLYELDRARNLVKRFTSSLARGDYQSVPIDQEVFLRARSIADQYSHRLKLRSLDAIHLATALHHGADEFATYDTRLAEAATLSGLKVIPSRS